jgi:ubiquinol-cytochrome c reductase core subunit 2
MSTAIGGIWADNHTAHEFHEEVQPIISLKQAKIDALSQALDTVHSVAFHTGLGESLYPSSSTPIGSYLNEDSVSAFAQTAYSKANIAVVSDGASQNGLTQWMEAFFRTVPATSSSTVSSSPSKYYGGEQRVARGGKNAYIIAFPGASLADNKAETSVLVALLGGESSISWTPGFTLLSKATAAAPGAQAIASNLAYSDAGLLTVQITGSAGAVKTAAEESVKALKSIVSGTISKEDLTKAIAKAKFDLLSTSELTGTGLVAAGSSLIHGGKPLQVADVLKSLDSVTADKLKTVSPHIIPNTPFT